METGKRQPFMLISYRGFDGSFKTSTPNEKPCNAPFQTLQSSAHSNNMTKAGVAVMEFVQAGLITLQVRFAV